MSSAALSWALHQVVKPASAKLLLLVLADHANPRTGRIFPSIARLVAFTGQNEKTVSAGLVRLIDIGILSDLGDKTGRTGRTRVFRLNPNWGGPMVPKTGGLAKSNTPENGGFEYPLKRATEPSIQEPRSQESPLPPDGVGDEGDVDLFGKPVVDPKTAFEDAIVERFVEGWNELSNRYEAISSISVMADRRRGPLLARVRERYTGTSIEEGLKVVNTVLERIDGSPFLCGQVKNWAITVDWALGPENFDKTMERRNERELTNHSGPTGSGSSAVVAGARALALVRDSRERAAARGGAGTGGGTGRYAGSNRAGAGKAGPGQ